MDRSKIKIETNRDPITSRVLQAIKTNEWNNDFVLNSELKTYHLRKTEITIEQ